MVNRPDVIGEKIVEGSLVGALMENPEGLIHCEQLLEHDFLSPMAGRAYKAILHLWRNNKKIDLATLCMHDKDLATWLPAVDPGFKTAIPEYVAGVIESARRRRIKKRIDEIGKIIMGEDSREILSTLAELCEKETTGDRNGKISEGIKRLQVQAQECQNAGGNLGLSTKIRFLDDEYIRMQRGHIWGIGGLTSHGKTMLMTSIITNQLRDNSSRQIIISTEMTTEQMVARLLACYSGIDTSVFLSGGHHVANQQKAKEAFEWLGRKNITIFDDIYEWSGIEGVVRSAFIRGGVDVVWIDYVQNCVVPGARNDYEAQSKLAKGLQRLAKKCKCTIIYLSQLPNSFLNGDHGETQFKGAGEWAAVADVGMFIRKSKAEKGTVEVEVRKNRHGKLVSGLMRFRGNWTRLED